MVDHFSNDDEQNSAETNDNTSMNSYDFISTNGEESDTNNFDTVGSMWNLGDHSTASKDERSALSQAIEDTMGDIDGDIDDDMMDVLEDASDLVKNTRVSKFECPVEACGLGHSHADHKHDIRQAFKVVNDFAEQMDFCPYCHCGVNELAMLVGFMPYITAEVFVDDEKFEDALELDPDILDSLYRKYNEEDATVNRAAGMLANDLGLPENEIVPLGSRESIKTFFERRDAIEAAAQAAPIAQETRTVIDDNREELEQLTSE